MIAVCVVSTKGGVGKTTTVANLGGFAADAGLRVLLMDLDVQPTLSSYYTLTHRAPGGIYELLASNDTNAENVISNTCIQNLDIVLSNDRLGQLNTLLLHAADGRLRLRHLLSRFKADYDLLLMDTQGARCVLLEMAVLASTLAISPVTPELLAAREFHRGTLQLMEDIHPFRHLGIELPAVKVLLNRVHPVSSNARLIGSTLREVFGQRSDVAVLGTQIPAIETYPKASTVGLPAHRIERTRPTGRSAPAALESIRALSSELFPHWIERFTSADFKR